MDDETEVHIETATLYVVGVLLIILRLSLRMWQLGYRKLQLDDYFVILILLLFTVLVVPPNYILSHEVSAVSDDATLEQTTMNAKLSVVFEQAILCLIYSTKACIIIMIGRLMTALKVEFRKLLMITSIFCGTAFVGSIVSSWSTCQPVSAHWTFPPTSEECTYYTIYLSLALAFNASSDMLILATTIPILIRSSIPKVQKLQLILLYGIGVFVIIMACLTKAYQFDNRDFRKSAFRYISWAFREASVAVYLCNLPVIIPILRKIFSKSKRDTVGSFSDTKLTSIDVSTQSTSMPFEAELREKTN